MELIVFRGHNNFLCDYHFCDDTDVHRITTSKSIFWNGVVEFHYFNRSSTQYLDLRLKQGMFRRTGEHELTGLKLRFLQ